VSDAEHHDDVGWLGLVRLQTIVGVPIREIHDFGRLDPGLRRFHRLYDIEPVEVEKERMLPKQVVELRNDGMILGNGSGFDLAKSSFDLCGREFHRTLLSVGNRLGNTHVAMPVSRGASHHGVVEYSVFPQLLT
jgi:hypothetical protein